MPKKKSFVVKCWLHFNNTLPSFNQIQKIKNFASILKYWTMNKSFCYYNNGPFLMQLSHLYIFLVYIYIYISEMRVIFYHQNSEKDICTVNFYLFLPLLTLFLLLPPKKLIQCYKIAYKSVHFKNKSTSF